MQRIWKELDECSCDLEDTPARKPRSHRPYIKRTLEFFGEIQTMIDNYFCKSVRSIAKDIGISEFLIRQVVHEDIQYFLYKMRKGQFLSQAMKNKRKSHAQKLLYTQGSSPVEHAFVFIR